MAEFLTGEKQRQALESERKGGKIFVGNIRKDVEKAEIEDAFVKYGEVLSVWIAKNPPGFCFVTYRDPEDAKDAVSQANGLECDFAEENGRGLRVESSTYAQRRHGGGGRERAVSRSRSRGRGRDRSRGRSGRGRGGGGGRDRGRDRDSRDRRRDSRSRDRRRSRGRRDRDSRSRGRR